MSTPALVRDIVDEYSNGCAAVLIVVWLSRHYRSVPFRAAAQALECGFAAVLVDEHVVVQIGD
jgi:hypothetical protein